MTEMELLPKLEEITDGALTSRELYALGQLARNVFYYASTYDSSEYYEFNGVVAFMYYSFRIDNVKQEALYDFAEAILQYNHEKRDKKVECDNRTD